MWISRHRDRAQRPRADVSGSRRLELACDNKGYAIGFKTHYSRTRKIRSDKTAQVASRCAGADSTVLADAVKADGVTLTLRDAANCGRQ